MKFSDPFLAALLLAILALVAAQNITVFSYEAHRGSCKHEIVESIPDDMNLSELLEFKPRITHEVLIELIDKAKKSLRIASFYFMLNAQDLNWHPSMSPSQQIMNSIVAAVGRGVDLEVILDSSSKRPMSNQEDVDQLKSLGTVRYLDMNKLFGAGVMHSKFLIADNKSLYLGSSNFDWRSYTQIKEIGIKFDDCAIMAQDLDKVFRTYAYISEFDQVPETLPEWSKTAINIDRPLFIDLDGFKAKMFLTNSPPSFNGIKESTGRTDDLNALLHIINKANKQIDISVMTYSPSSQYMKPKIFWPHIDDALKRAAIERRVRVRILLSEWTQTKTEELMWYRSLNAVQSPSLEGGGIYVRMFKIPAYDDFQKKVPYSRVKHDKFMVTDNGLFIGTSNWTPEYFINTAGSSFVIEPAIEGTSAINNGTIIANMQSLFERDYTSEYSTDL